MSEERVRNCSGMWASWGRVEEAIAPSSVLLNLASERSARGHSALPESALPRKATGEPCEYELKDPPRFAAHEELAVLVNSEAVNVRKSADAGGLEQVSYIRIVEEGDALRAV